MPRVAQVAEVPGVADAIATGEPLQCAKRIAQVLRGGTDRDEVARTAALTVARRFVPRLPPSHAFLALSASFPLASIVDPPDLPFVQACALAASEYEAKALAGASHTVAGDELHLGRSFVSAVRTGDVLEADAIFSGLLREGDERRLAGDVLFEVSAQDMAAEGHKLTFAVGVWRLARVLGWLQGNVLLRPAVHLAAATTQDLAGYAATMREVGRSRLDLELAARNVAPTDEVARNAYAIALSVSPERLVQEVINGLKRGRSPSAYANLVVTTAMQHLVRNPAALEPAINALAVRFVLDFSGTASHVLGLLLATRSIARFSRPGPMDPAPVSDEATGLDDLRNAIETGDANRAARLALGLADVGERLPRFLTREAVLGDPMADAGHRLLYAVGALEFATVATGPSYASLAAVLARAPKSRTIAEAV